MSDSRVALCLPDLELPRARITISQWLVGRHKRVTAGERLVEILADGVTVDLPAPVTGQMVEIVAFEDEEIAVGQPLCWITPDQAEQIG